MNTGLVKREKVPTYVGEPVCDHSFYEIHAMYKTIDGTGYIWEKLPVEAETSEDAERVIDDYHATMLKQNARIPMKYRILKIFMYKREVIVGLVELEGK